MLFNSLHFVFFFPIVVLFYYFIPRRWQWAFLLVTSYYFYMAWKIEYVFLLLFSTGVDYYAALRMGQTALQASRRKYLWLSLCANLGLLFSFKYVNFFNEATRQFLNQFNVFYNVPTFELLLPVGISFYTFQTLSYTIDVYQGKIQPERHFGYFALYVSFWPQLVAGPIERSGKLLPQLKQTFDFDYEQIKLGLIRVLWGFFKKLVIADRLAIYVNEIYNNPGLYKGGVVLLATYFFAFQLYCDFSGYSDIAIGSAQILGIRLSENFRRPFFAKSPADLWRRWHITLTNWFRDYLMFPMMRHSAIRLPWYMALLITYILVGLWHGGNWNFLIWGLLHGFFIIVGRWYHFYSHFFTSRLFSITIPRQLISLLQVVLTFHLMVISALFFRASTVSQAFTFLKTIFLDWQTLSAPPMPKGWPDFVLSFLFIIILLVSEYIMRDRTIEETISPKPVLARWTFYTVGLLTVLWFGVFTQEQFIYFEF